MPGRTPAAWACGIRIDDAAVVIVGIDDDQRRGARGRTQRGERQLRHVRGDPQLARLERESGLVSLGLPVPGAEATPAAPVKRTASPPARDREKPV